MYPGRRLGRLARRRRAARGPDLLGQLPRRQHADVRAELLAARRAGRRAVLQLPPARLRRLPAACRATRATSRRGSPARIAELGPFELLTRGDELPVFAFTLKDDVDNYTVFDVSNALRERGWQRAGVHVPGEPHRPRGAARRRPARLHARHGRHARRRPRAPASAAREAARAGARRGVRERLRALMCRWLAYSGSPVLLSRSFSSSRSTRSSTRASTRRMGAETTNGDGFGIGWYGDGRHAGNVPQRSSRRGTTGTCATSRRTSSRSSSSRTSARRRDRPCSRRTATRSATDAGCGCTTGSSATSTEVKRELVLAVDPALYPSIEGSTDSEVFFYLALTLGLEDDPPGAVERAVGLSSSVGHAPRRRAPDPDDGGDDRRDSVWGVPLLERGEVALALLLHARRHAARAAPRGRGAAPGLRRVAARRVRAARRSRGRLERGARIDTTA